MANSRQYWQWKYRDRFRQCIIIVTGEPHFASTTANNCHRIISLRAVGDNCQLANNRRNGFVSLQERWIQSHLEMVMPRIVANYLIKIRDRKSTRLNSSHVKISYA